VGGAKPLHARSVPERDRIFGEHASQGIRRGEDARVDLAGGEDMEALGEVPAQVPLGDGREPGKPTGNRIDVREAEVVAHEIDPSGGGDLGARVEHPPDGRAAGVDARVLLGRRLGLVLERLEDHGVGLELAGELDQPREILQIGAHHHRTDGEEDVVGKATPLVANGPKVGRHVGEAGSEPDAFIDRGDVRVDGHVEVVESPASEAVHVARQERGVRGQIHQHLVPERALDQKLEVDGERLGAGRGKAELPRRRKKALGQHVEDVPPEATPARAEVARTHDAAKVADFRVVEQDQLGQAAEHPGSAGHVLPETTAVLLLFSSEIPTAPSLGRAPLHLTTLRAGLHSCPIPLDPTPRSSLPLGRASGQGIRIPPAGGVSSAPRTRSVRAGTAVGVHEPSREARRRRLAT